MKKRTLITIACLALAAIALGAAMTQAQAKPKKWVRVITMVGGEETYTDQYRSRLFTLNGGAQKMTCGVRPDSDLAELDMADWWSGSWSIEKQGGRFDYASMTMDGLEGSATAMSAPFHLMKGRYRVFPSSANCSWWYTLWEKR